MDSAEVIWKRYQVGNMKGDNGRSIGSSGRFSNSMLTNLPRCTMSLGAETAQQLHHVVFMFCRRITNAEDPIKQVGVRAIEQRLEPPELIVVQGREGVLGERPENEVAFLRPAMPAPKQQALAADIRMFVICGLRSSMFHRLFSMSLLRTIIATISTPSASANDQLAGWRNETIGALVFPRADQHWICATLLLLQFRTARQSMLHYALLLLRRLNATAGFGTRLLDSAKSCAKFSSARDPPNL